MSVIMIGGVVWSKEVDKMWHRYLLVLERKTRGRQLHLAKRFGPKRVFFSCNKKVQNKSRKMRSTAE